MVGSPRLKYRVDDLQQVPGIEQALSVDQLLARNVRDLPRRPFEKLMYVSYLLSRDVVLFDAMSQNIVRARTRPAVRPVAQS